MKKYLSYLLVLVVLVSVDVVIVSCFLNRKYDISKIEESLVYIEAINDSSISSGSGFIYKIMDNKNYIVTNYHIIEGYNDIYVYGADKKQVNATIFGYDEDMDIAILEINDELNLKEVKIGDSNKLNIGNVVYAVGTPIDYRYFSTFTKGIVSYLNRKIVVDGNTYETIQVDASINSGNSGGPLIDKKGNVIGVVFIKETDIDGIGFVLPINDVIIIINRILKYKG